MTSVGIMASAVDIAAAAPIPTVGLRAWYDADDASTFTYSSGTVVSQWRDKSGGSRHMNQATVANQPNRNGTWLGRPAVVFDGSNDQMETAAPVTAATDNVTVFVVAWRTGGDPGYCPVMFNGSAGFGLGIRAQGSTIGMLQSGVQWHMTSTPDPQAPAVYCLKRASGVWSLRLNRAASNLSTSFTPATPGVLQMANNSMAGQFHEGIFYERALPDVERDQVELYLKTKWGTA